MSIAERIRPQPLLSIAERLAMAAGPVEVEALAAAWRQADVIVRSTAPIGFSLDDSLCGRIRGALGNALIERLDRDSNAGSAFDLCFNDAPDWRRFYPDAARPFSLAASWRGRDLSVRLRLFGFAQFLAPAFSRWLPAALQRGIAVADGARSRVALTTTHVSAVRRESFRCSDHTKQWACAIFRSPVTVLQGERALISADRVIRSVARRIASLARWQDLQIDAEALERILFEFDWDLRSRSCSRAGWSSGRQRRSGIILQGERGVLIGIGRSQRIETPLRLAQLTQVGARTAFGFGDVRCFVV